MHPCLPSSAQRCVVARGGLSLGGWYRTVHVSFWYRTYTVHVPYWYRTYSTWYHIGAVHVALVFACTVHAIYSVLDCAVHMQYSYHAVLYRLLESFYCSYSCMTVCDHCLLLLLQLHDHRMLLLHTPHSTRAAGPRGGHLGHTRQRSQAAAAAAPTCVSCWARACLHLDLGALVARLPSACPLTPLHSHDLGCSCGVGPPSRPHGSSDLPARWGGVEAGRGVGIQISLVHVCVCVCVCGGGVVRVAVVQGTATACHRADYPPMCLTPSRCTSMAPSTYVPDPITTYLCDPIHLCA